jgi:hypothetical protein
MRMLALWIVWCSCQWPQASPAQAPPPQIEETSRSEAQPLVVVDSSRDGSTCPASAWTAAITTAWESEEDRVDERQELLVSAPQFVPDAAIDRDIASPRGAPPSLPFGPLAPGPLRC